MKLHMAAALAFLLIQTPVNPTTQQKEAPKGSIEGVVSRTATGEPLARAQVTLNRILPPTPPPPPGQPTPAASLPPAQIPQQSTESDGKFTFKDLDAGQYRLTVASNGYARQEYGERAVFGTGTIINLTAGQAMKDISFRMIQNGTVTGNVRDSKGDPVAGLAISLMRPVYNVNGQRTLSTAGTAITDDRGNYRAFWIPPGRYYVSVGAASPTISVLVLNSNVVADRIFPTTYYPGVTDPVRATIIEIQPGMELNGIDVLLTLPMTYRIRGRVIDTTGQTPRGFSVQHSARTDSGAPPPLTTTLPGYSAITNPAIGPFELRNVMLGSYWLRATMLINADDPVPANLATGARTAVELLDLVLGSNRATAQLAVELTNSDIENANLTMMPTLSIPLRVSLDDMELSQLGGMDRIRVNLRSTSPNSPSTQQRSALSGDGRGTIDSVSPGEYRVVMTLGTQPDLFLKEAQFGVKDALNDPIQITNPGSDSLNIVLSNKGGRIDGTLVDALATPKAGIQVVLIPDESSERTELYKNATTDQAGRFTIRGIPPRTYKLFAWEAIENYSYFDRDVLSSYESQGKPVKIQESSKEAIELKIIPAPKQ